MFTAGSTPAASTSNFLIFNSLQKKSAGKAKNIAKLKLFIIIEISKPTLKAEEPASGKRVKYFAPREILHKISLEAPMRTATQTRKLIPSHRTETRAEAGGLCAGDNFDLENAGRRLGLTQEQMAIALNLPVRSLLHSNAWRGTNQSNMRITALRGLLLRMDDYVVASKENEWLSSPLEAFGGRSPRELITEGRMRDLITALDRLREGQPV